MEWRALSEEIDRVPPPPLSEEEEEDEVEEVEEEAVCVCVFGPDIVIPTLCLWEDDVGRIIISWVVDRE